MKPTDSELEILQILWDKGPSTVKEIHEVISRTKDVGYTTSLKILQIMNEKGLVDREKQGKTHIYNALVSREKTQEELASRVLNNVFGGSAKKMVMSLLGNNKSSKKEIDEIRKYLDGLEEE